MSSERLYSEKFSRDKVNDERPDNLQEFEARTALKNEIVKQEVFVPPTRMQRKFNRMFGAGKDTSAMMVTGF